MKKLLVYLLLTTALSAVFFSCKKYEDGPTISFIPKTKRLAGDWDFEKVTYTSGGTETDITSYFAGSKWNIQEDGTGSLNITGSSNEPFTWSWDDKREHVTFVQTSDGSSFTVEILRLKNKELWFKETDSSTGDVIEYHLAQ